MKPDRSRLSRFLARRAIGFDRATHESGCPDCAEGRTTYDDVTRQCIPRRVRNLDLLRGLLTRVA